MVYRCFFDFRWFLRKILDGVICPLCGIGASFQSGNTALRIMLVDEQEIENLLNEHSDSEYEWQNDNEL